MATKFSLGDAVKIVEKPGSVAEYHKGKTCSVKQVNLLADPLTYTCLLEDGTPIAVVEKDLAKV